MRAKPPVKPQNLSLDDSGHIPLPNLPSDSTTTVIKVIKSDVFYGLSGFNPQKTYGSDGDSIVLKICFLVNTRSLRRDLLTRGWGGGRREASKP